MGDKRQPDPRSGLDEDGRWSPAFPGQRPPLESGHPWRVREGNKLGLRHGANSEAELGPLRDSIFERLVEIAPFGEINQAAGGVLAAVLSELPGADGDSVVRAFRVLMERLEEVCGGLLELEAGEDS